MPTVPTMQNIFVVEYLGEQNPRLDVDRMIDDLKTFEQWMDSTTEAEKEETRRQFGDLKAFYDRFANALNEVKEWERSPGVRHGQLKGRT